VEKLGLFSVIEHSRKVSNTPGSYSGLPRFKYLSKGWLPSGLLWVSLGPSSEHFLAHSQIPCTLIIQPSNSAITANITWNKLLNSLVCGQEDQGVGDRFFSGAEIFLFISSQTSPTTHRPGNFPWNKAAGAWGYYSPPSGVEVNTRARTSIPLLGIYDLVLIKMQKQLDL
jgi:hypothetical protein